MSLIQRLFRIFLRIRSFFYWGLFKSCFKFLSRKYTGLHEIERKAFSNDVKGFYSSIKHSKVLHRIKQYFKIDIYTEKSLNTEVIEEIFTQKNIDRTRNKVEMFVEVSNKLFNTIKSKQYLEDVRKTRFDHEDKAHQASLLKFWNLLKNNEPLPTIITRKWIDVGFQGEDPATDFRGAGFLGLENLIYFVEVHQQNALIAYQGSCAPQHQYFFAAAGLYITLELFHMLKKHYFDELFYEASDKEKALIIFGEIYSAAFHMFDRFWVKQSNASIMTFNTIAIEFFSQINGPMLPQLKDLARDSCLAKELF